MENYYEILGITEDEKRLPEAEFAEVCNKKYKKLALRWHPDRWVNGTDEEKKTAEEKFKEISEAKDVLSDPQKRRTYDNGGADPDMGGFGFNPFGFFRNRHANMYSKGDDVMCIIKLTFDEAYRGIKHKEFSYNKLVHCHHCNGTGAKDGLEHTCPDCNGTGMITETKTRGNMIFQTSHPCGRCNGTGKLATNPCSHCNGTGLENVTVTEYIDIPDGVFTGAGMRMQGMGSEPKGEGINGDLIIKIEVINDSYFERDDLNIVHKEKVPFTEALLGCEREIKCPDGSKFILKIPQLTKDGEHFIKANLGFKDVVNGTNTKGDYIIEIKYTYPSKLTNKQKEMLKNFNDD